MSDEVRSTRSCRHQLGSQHLQDRARNYMTIRNVESVAKFDCRCADNYFLVLNVFQCNWIAPQDINI